MNYDYIVDLDSSEVKKIDPEKLKAMTNRANRKPCLAYPEDPNKANWDIFLTLVLIASCFITPYRIGFGPTPEKLGWTIVSDAIDVFFLVDMIVMFNTAFYNEEYIIVENRGIIAIEYFKGWFAIDLLAIIPFERILSSESDDHGNSLNKFARIPRVARITKIVKLTRLLRVLKIIKERNKLLRYMNESLKIGHGFERLTFFSLVFIILIHCVACIMVVAGDLLYEEDVNDSWISPYIYLKEQAASKLYIIAVYFATSTITTVGYGDISGQNVEERLVNIFVMLIGVIAFSFMTGALSSIL